MTIVELAILLVVAFAGLVAAVLNYAAFSYICSAIVFMSCVAILVRVPDER